MEKEASAGMGRVRVTSETKKLALLCLSEEGGRCGIRVCWGWRGGWGRGIGGETPRRWIPGLVQGSHA